MLRVALVVALTLLPAPALPQTTPFRCEEVALDMTGCGDPPALEGCPDACLDPDNPTDETCGMLPLLELPITTPAGATQPILRQVAVTGGPYLGAMVSLVALNRSADAIFAAARDQLCKAPPPPPTPTPPANDPGATPAPTGAGPGLYLGGGPVWYGPRVNFR